jgi:hypothetical protein
LNRYVAAVLVILICIVIAMAAYPPFGSMVRDALASAGGGTWLAFEAWWAGVASTAIYQSYHMFIWLGAGMVLMFLLFKLHKRGKIPFMKPKTTAQPMMTQPQTIIVQPNATPTGAQPQKQQDQNQPAQSGS